MITVYYNPERKELRTPKPWCVTVRTPDTATTTRYETEEAARAAAEEAR